MNKIFKKVISLALIGTLCIGASTTTFASELSPEAKAEATQTNESERKVNWWQVGWKVLSDYFEKLIDLDGQSVKDSNWAYLVSPSIEFNTGEMGNEVYFKPEVNNSVGSMRMHGHRVILLIFLLKSILFCLMQITILLVVPLQKRISICFTIKKRVILPESGKLSLFLLKVSNGSAIMHTIIMQILEVHCQK